MNLTKEMKTPMQELIETLKEMQESLDPYGLHEAIEMAESLLEKEKKDRKAVFSIAYRMMPTEYDSAHIDSEFNEFNEIFKTK
jgi:hypothetical protein